MSTFNGPLVRLIMTGLLSGAVYMESPWRFLRTLLEISWAVSFYQWVSDTLRRIEVTCEWPAGELLSRMLSPVLISTCFVP